MVYAVLADVKRLCGIDQADTTYDNLFNNTIFPPVDKHVDADMSDFVTQIPLSGNELVSETRTLLANHRSAVLYGIEAHDQFIVDQNRTAYKESLDAFKKIVTKMYLSTRSKFVVVASDYESEPIYSSRN
jgi:hypothetical protein